MSVASSGEMRLALDYMREMFADSATWRAVVESPLSIWADTLTLITAGNASKSNALAAVKIGAWQGQDDHDDYKAPPVITVKHNTFRGDRRAVSGFDLEGQIEAMIVVPVPTSYRDDAGRFTQDGYKDFYNKVGRILSEVRELPRANGYLDIHSLEMTDHGFCHPADGIDQCFVAVASIDWRGAT